MRFGLSLKRLLLGPGAPPASTRTAHVIASLQNPFMSEEAREQKETEGLYQAARAAFDASPLSALDPGDFGCEVVCGALRPAGYDPASDLGRALCRMAVALLEGETVFQAPHLATRELGLEEAAALRTALRAQQRFLSDLERHLSLVRGFLERACEVLLEAAPSLPGRGAGRAVDYFLRAPLVDLLENPARAVEELMLTAHHPDLVRAGLFRGVRAQLEYNTYVASGIDPAAADESRKAPVLPTKARGAPAELVEAYLAGTPFADLLSSPLPVEIPSETRFEHTHVVGGTGHGKTQLLQFLIHRDLIEPRKRRPAVFIIDSQGDLIRTITHLAIFRPDSAGSLAEKFVLIDPNDVEHPPCLNLFDLGLERVARYSPVEREKILHGTVALFEYMFGALLGAELTQRQGVIFKYLARLMMVIPGSTIQTLRELMEDHRPFRPYVDRLDGAARRFFETQFSARGFAPTKQQILQRLWGILSNPVLERMFSHTENKVDLYDAMQSGKIVVINTAKDLLKQDGSQLLGRFFLAMLGQATLERAVLSPEARRPCFVYVDEAAEYFDETIGDMLNQARKYRVGLVLAHQNLDQLGDRLRATIMASTSVKLAGGVSAKDARALAEEMRCAGEFIQGAKKRGNATEFACYVRNMTPHAIRVSVPLGHVEQEPSMTEAEYVRLLAENRARYCAPKADMRFRWPVELEAPAATETRREPERERPPERAPPQPAPPERPPAHVRPMGRGGEKHVYLQEFVKRLGEDLGYRAVIEQQIPGGQVDVGLERGGFRVACEISITTSRAHELANIRKCLTAGYDRVLVVCPQGRRLQSLEALIRENVERRHQSRVSVLPPEDVGPHLGAVPHPESTSSEQTVRGYRVKVEHKPMSPAEQKARRQAIAKVIARSLRQMPDASGESS